MNRLLRLVLLLALLVAVALAAPTKHAAAAMRTLAKDGIVPRDALKTGGDVQVVTNRNILDRVLSRTHSLI